MKKAKVWFITFLATFLFSASVSQKIYFPFHCGYNESSASQGITTKSFYTPQQSTQTLIKGSLGKGFSLLTGIGYKRDSILSFEILFHGLKGAKFSGYYTQDTVSKSSIEISAWMVRIAPAIKAQFYAQKKWSPYLKMFPIVRLAGHINTIATYEDLKTQNITVTGTKYFNGLSLGLGASAGVQKRLTERLHLVFEFTFISQSWAPKNADVVKYTVNGEDQLPQLNSAYKHIHYSSAVNNGKFSSYRPSNQLSQYHPFSSLGLNVGLIFNLGKKKK